MSFEEILALLMDPPDGGVDATVYDDLNASYMALDGERGAAVEEVEAMRATIEALQAELAAEKEECRTLRNLLYGKIVNGAGDTPPEPDDETEPEEIIEEVERD